MTSIDTPRKQPKVIWEKLPEDYILPEEPVESILQPLLAFALNEALDLAGLLTPAILVAIDMAICANLDGKTVVKAPDWFYVPDAEPTPDNEIRRSYTPRGEGDIQIVMEFLSDSDCGEYSTRPVYPYGKFWFYERILQVPYYVIFDPARAILEVRSLQGDRYELLTPDRDGRYFLPPLNLSLGIWHGKRQEITAYWLRWWDSEGNMLLWASERIAREQQRAERLARRLREMGIDPEENG
ncbi:Uma2 family endonuclease [Pannus brasiliensis CCIBt3594]|uniref:Uma2 family endonuclease n=1 Tax=Pannus brasiliensis CCIBt3594 TaxID=1427578 RepID=A0AAW9QHC6_9CHRO